MSHTLAMGGLGALGIIGMPLMIAAMLLKQPPGPVAKLIAAKATSPIFRPFLAERGRLRGRAWRAVSHPWRGKDRYVTYTMMTDTH